ncbi:hypothetical protein SAMN05444285_101175 [Draconibacterium orientale]|uniref:Uncharacterized protein n=1 Tax=Draconibacterium orientale TaxID=1168034 RepID=X5DLT9_9BACT|nr:hypothetical protein [Draconibacterium orientale]AHW62209.1 hypothetical protein FH5T_17505 [Draconibacterium orientale]SES68016.1 hypothetical protein SAMN05444285_101175 [Draconibacterium orientale]
MESKLAKITNGYHTFIENQVLTAEQLNEFVNYLDDQNRLSKVFLHGVGIVCGFPVKMSQPAENGPLNSDNDNTVEIGQGVGLTTDGDLLQLKKASQIIDGSVTYTHYKKFTDEVAEYEPFREDSEVIDMWEIFPESGDNRTKLNNLKLDDKIALLYIESYEDGGNLCTSIDCDNQGIKQVQNLRVLLVTEKGAEQIIKNDSVFTWHNVPELYTQLPEIKLPRISLLNVDSLAAFRQSFLAAFSQTVITNLKDGYEAILDLFGLPSVSTKIDELLKLNLSAINSMVDFQYRYDLLADLIDTYNEIKKLLLHINVECSPAIDSFPKHLLLGRLQETEPYKTFRHRVYKSPLSATEQFNRSKIKSLILRAQHLLNNYNVTLNESVQEIRITPSQLNGELGCKAIPFYYNLDAGFLETWSFEKTTNLKQNYNLSYSTDVLANVPEVQSPLQFSTDEFNFYRIEGHLGLDAEACENEIDNLLRTNGLDFKCRIIPLDDTENPFAQFLKKHSQAVHRGGVVKGGTFLLVAQQNKVVSDLFLPYRIIEETAQNDCCSLMECTYPWISSLKYLNNLARSTKGTQSRNKVMPKEYVLQVVEYRINRQNLINGTTTIRIPLQQIFLRRIHAITEALNTRFDKGVVFDFNESQKRFVITRAKEDSFVIRLRDVTLNYSNPIYTYSNKGMFRNNLVFRADAMRCRDLKKYNPTFYEALQGKIAPVNKDDDYGKFNDKWAKWNVLKERIKTHPEIVRLKLTRMISSASELPGEIKRQLRTLKADFQQRTETDLQFKLDGDWVTGDWVNSTMLDFYKANKKNTHDDLVLFVQLRKYLHSETGVTKLSIYLTNELYTNNFDELIERYSGFADIYFGTPTGENAIDL